MGNTNLQNAKQAKNDEFYTRLEDIEKEVKHYRQHFEGKVVYCNCDDSKKSNFFKYFALNFERLGLKKLIATGYNKGGHGSVFIYEGDKNGNRLPDDEEITNRQLNGDGDFRSPECVEFLKEADIVVTNPPFSLFREYIAQLMEYGKMFLVIGNMNAVTYKEVFPLIKDNRLWLGYGFSGGNAYFKVPYRMEYASGVYDENTGLVKFRNCHWFTNLDHDKRHERIELYKRYSIEYYPKYDNYDAIEVSKTCEIPMDYDGVMGVPITYLDKHNPEQFEIVGMANSARWIGDFPCYTIINGKKIYNRILIRNLCCE